MRIVRVFPRRTRATPTDQLVFVNCPPPLFIPECDEVHISVAFTWDLPRANELAIQWRRVAPVMIGGPAIGEPGGEFIPGRYVDPGYVITSRGCPNHCWFCSVWRRERGGVRELQITEGWNVLDDNLLACSEGHIESVFAMLKRQPRRAEFTGGLEAKLLTPKLAGMLADLRPRRIYFAYDTEDDREPLGDAVAMLRRSELRLRPTVSCYVLIGYPRDTFYAADRRLRFVLGLGIMPFAMLYRDKDGKYDVAWRRFQRQWCRPQIVGTKFQVATQ